MLGYCAMCKPFKFPHIISIHISSTQWIECLKIISFKRERKKEKEIKYMIFSWKKSKIGRNKKIIKMNGFWLWKGEAANGESLSVIIMCICTYTYRSKVQQTTMMGRRKTGRERNKLLITLSCLFFAGINQESRKENGKEEKNQPKCKCIHEVSHSFCDLLQFYCIALCVDGFFRFEKLPLCDF